MKNGCWESNYNLNQPYGVLRFNNKRYGHHVLMYILYHGDICGITSIIHHECNNTRCVNPNHLKKVTHIENINFYHRIGNQLITEEKHKYIGVSKNSQLKCFNSAIKIDYKNINLGHYKTQEEAAQNRDYYIVRNNLLEEYSLNFHDIDYYKFKPWPQIGGKINKYVINKECSTCEYKKSE